MNTVRNIFTIIGIALIIAGGIVLYNETGNDLAILGPLSIAVVGGILFGYTLRR